MASAYMVYLQENGAAFFNPAPSLYGNPDPEIGSALNGCIAIARGTQEQAEAIAASINATLPVVPSFEQLLGDQG